MIEYGSERVSEIWKEIYPLFEKHWDEISHFKDIPLEPDYDLYVKMDGLGMVRVYTARENGVLIGYSVYLIRPNLHYKSSLQANQDVIYIRPERRGFGSKFIAWCDEKLREEKVQIVTHHVKEAHDFSPVLKRMGYELVDKLYCRRLF